MAIFKIFKKSKKSPSLKEKTVSAASSEDKIAEEKKVFAKFNFSAPFLLKRPVLSEKAGGTGEGKYVFEVDLKANKPLVKETVENRYGVKVKAVNIIRTKKSKTFSRLRKKSVFHIKKAAVSLMPGEKIQTL